MALMDDVLARVAKKCNNDRSKDQLDKVDININDENGNYKGLEQILNELSSVLQEEELG